MAAMSYTIPLSALMYRQSSKIDSSRQSARERVKIERSEREEKETQVSIGSFDCPKHRQGTYLRVGPVTGDARRREGLAAAVSVPTHERARYIHILVKLQLRDGEIVRDVEDSLVQKPQ